MARTPVSRSGRTPSDTSRSPKGAGGGGGLSTYLRQAELSDRPRHDESYSNGKRQVPDVSADADPDTGYSVYCTVDGVWLLILWLDRGGRHQRGGAALGGHRGGH